MKTSDSIKSIAAALVAFHKEVGKISKDSTNPFFKSKYASLSNILDGINEPLHNNGLAIVQFPEDETGLTTRLVHTSGEWMESTYQMKSTKDTPQDRGSAMTYQRRYAVGAILSLNIDEDDDGNKASQQNGKVATSYNHKKLDEPGKPLITNKQFKQACERIEGGDLDVFKKVIKDFSMTPDQLSLLTQIHNNQKQPA